MKIKFFLPLLFIFCISSQAQMAVGFHFGGTYYIGIKPMLNLGGNFIFPIAEQPIEVGISYHLPIKYASTDYANPFSSSNNQIEVDINNKISIIDIRASYRYYFSDNEFDDGGLYANGGFALGIGTEKVTVVTPYDKTTHYMDEYYDKSSHLYFQPYIHIALGYDKLMDNDQMIGGQLFFNLTGGTYNSRSGSSVDANIPGCVGLRLTYTLPLGN